MPAKRITITQPVDWVEAWTEQAAKEGMSLSEWIGAACNEQLPKKVQSNLTERGTVGRPPSDEV